MEMTVPNSCQICGERLLVERVACPSCGCAVEHKFQIPRLSRLTAEEQKFVEMFIMHSGNLKKIAATLGISYPTVRNRLDNVMASLDGIAKEDQKKKEALIDSVERGEIPAALAARILEEA